MSHAEVREKEVNDRVIFLKKMIHAQERQKQRHVKDRVRLAEMLHARRR